MEVREQESRVRKAGVYYPSSGDWRHGFAYKYMYPMAGRDGSHYYNNDYPYAKQHLRTPNWVGLSVDTVIPKIKGGYRVIPPGAYAPTDSYIGNRLNLFIDENRKITSISYF